jgi:predicted NAD/FAD-binding protein
MKRIAVVGSGITGLGAAHLLAKQHHVTLFEREDYAGGHAHTVDVTLDGITHGVDTGFLVFNHRTYPNLLALFNELNVPTAKSDMSFSVRLAGGAAKGLEWAGHSLNSVFAQRRNLLRPRFLRMLRDLLRFNKQATDDILHHRVGNLSLGEYLKRGGYSREMIDWYLVPMAACIWSCPTETMMAYPAKTFLQFCHNHGLLTGFEGRPQWYTVQGGSREYVKRILAGIHEVRLSTPVHAIHRGARQLPVVESARGRESFDAVVLATHSDTTLRLLAQPQLSEQSVFSRLRYQPNRAVLHTDASVLPKRQLAWSSWNYETHDAGGEPQVCCHYLINMLQPLPFKTPVVVSLNPITEPKNVIAEYEYDHPIFDAAAVAAQQDLSAIQGNGGVWFGGAWAGYGFHEDGLKAGLAAARGVLDALGVATARAAE